LFSKHGLLGVTTVGTMSGTNANDMLAFALREMLERNGALDEMKAQVRMLVTRCIDKCLPSSSNGGTALPTQPIENVLINEIVAEYLSFNGYVNTLSMFAAERQTSESDRLGETFIRQELGLFERPQETGLAVMYEIVEAMRARRSS
jgi:lisH domain-containing protein FOPNL